MKRIVSSFMLILSIYCSLGIAAVNLQMGGSVYTQVRYTPEDLFEAGHRIRVGAWLLSGNNPQVYLGFSGYQPYDNQFMGFDGQLKPSLGFGFGRTWVRIESNLYGGKPVIFTLGTVPLNYSPYTLKLDTYDLDNYMRKGIKVENISLLKGNLESFVVWGDSMEEFTYGAKLTKKLFGFDLNGIFINYGKYNREEIEDGRNAYRLSEGDSVTSLEARRYLGNNLLFTGIVAKNNQITGTEENGFMMVKYDLEIRLGNGNTAYFGYRDFQPGFRPKWADHTKRFDQNNFRPGAWNPIDRFANQQGFTIRLENKDKYNQLAVEYDHALVRQTLQEKRQTFAFDNQFMFGAYRLVTRADYQLRNSINNFGLERAQLLKWSDFRLERRIETDLGPVICGIKTMNENDLYLSFTTKGTYLDWFTSIGPYKNIKFSAGRYIETNARDREKRSFWNYGFDYTFPGGINVSLRQSTSNRSESFNYVPNEDLDAYYARLFNHWNERREYDNVFTLSAMVTF